MANNPTHISDTPVDLSSIPLEQFLREMCMALDFDTKKYQSFIPHFRYAITHCGYKFEVGTRTAEYEISSFNDCELPFDAISVLSVGLKLGDRVVKLFEDKNLYVNRDNVECEKEESINDIVDYLCDGEQENGTHFSSTGYAQNGEFVGERYSKEGGGYPAHGFYKYNESKKSIHIANALNMSDAKLVVEYFINMNVQGMDFVPIVYSEYLKQLTLYSYFNTRNENKAMFHKQRATVEEGIVDKVLYPRSVELFIHHFTRNYKSSPK